MRNRFLIISTVVILMLLITGASAALAQDAGGAILGTVYNDQDANGVCVGTGERGIPGITVQFANTQAAIQTALQTNQDGSFGYTSAGYGTWNVTVQPPAGWYATSAQTRQTALTSSQPVISGLDFCITQGTPPGGSGGSDGGTGTEDSSGSGGAVTLPESGAPIAPTLLVAALIGIGLIILGAGFYFYSRRVSA